MILPKQSVPKIGDLTSNNNGNFIIAWASNPNPERRGNYDWHSSVSAARTSDVCDFLAAKLTQ